MLEMFLGAQIFVKQDMCLSGTKIFRPAQKTFALHNLFTQKTALTSGMGIKLGDYELCCNLLISSPHILSTSDCIRIAAFPRILSLMREAT